ncbi:hypothetical protein GCM10027598_48040 [Amycolatopsis oliviviridis]|uniref:Uncharacterized protein n=1 Tax=Amycolatopsis oliviviridis TaxID=1471590 RepID=A0ABQ3MAU0_9PSEU|nr:hypothetical protein [Amycolatopsis oliviviridis]GHH37862.1 hypothetical protein GCM10017790_82880 [Amycolatopsis oliviviridis]
MGADDAVSNPERDRGKIGLSADLLEFTMPRPPDGRPGDMASFTVDACLELAKASKAFSAAAATGGGSVLFIGIGVVAKRIARGAVFEAGISNTLSLFADGQIDAAKQALSDAQNETGEQQRHDRLLVAEGHLTGAYAMLVRDIEKNVGKKTPSSPGKRADALRALYVNAMAAAATTASILREQGSRNVVRWADNADRHLAAFGDFTAHLYGKDRDSLPAAEREFEATRMTPGKVIADMGKVGISVATLLLAKGRHFMPPPQLNVDRATSASIRLEACRVAKKEMDTLARIRSPYAELKAWWLESA